MISVCGVGFVEVRFDVFGASAILRTWLWLCGELSCVWAVPVLGSSEVVIPCLFLEGGMYPPIGDRM